MVLVKSWKFTQFHKFYDSYLIFLGKGHLPRILFLLASLLQLSLVVISPPETCFLLPSPRQEAPYLPNGQGRQWLRDTLAKGKHGWEGPLEPMFFFFCLTSIQLGSYNQISNCFLTLRELIGLFSFGPQGLLRTPDNRTHELWTEIEYPLTSLLPQRSI